MELRRRSSREWGVSPVSRSNRTNSVRRRSAFTGESHQLAHDETAKLAKGDALIPDARTAAQQRMESAILHRLLHGARAQRETASRSEFPLFIKAACPSIGGLRLVVPVRNASAFGAALAMHRDSGVPRPPSDEISIRYKSGSTLLLTAEGTSAPENAVVLHCPWKVLCASVAAEPDVSAPSGLVLRFHAGGTLDIPDDSRAVLSALLRRISLFTEPAALDWLFTWHDWLVRDRRRRQPSPPARLLSELSEPSYGLQPALLSTLGNSGSAFRPMDTAVPRSESWARPTIAREIMGRQLQSLRKSAGIGIAAAARSIRQSASAVTRMELGHSRIKELDLMRLLSLYGVTESGQRLILRELNARLNEGWWRHFGHPLDSESVSRFVLESMAEFIWEYNVRLVPSLLQTRGYAEEVLRLRPIEEDRIQRLLELHSRRQSESLERGAGRIWAILNYSAIVAEIGSPNTMHEQIEFLVHASELPHVSIQVLLPGAVAESAAGSSFTYLRLRGESLPDVVHPHLFRSQVLFSRPEETEPYQRAMGYINVAAETPDQTREILQVALRRIEGRRPLPR